MKSIIEDIQDCIIQDTTSGEFLKNTNYEHYGYIMDAIVTKEARRLAPHTCDLIVKLLESANWQKIESK